MKNFKLPYLAVLFIICCAFQCEEHFECQELSDFRDDFEIQLSSTDAVFSKGDLITVSGSFSHIIEDDNSNTLYSVSGEAIIYDFDVFEVLPNNLNVSSADDKVEISTDDLLSGGFNSGIEKKLRMNCDESCDFEINFNLLEKGYYGIVLKTGDFVSMEDCVVVGVNGVKSSISNIEILEEIGTETINYEIQSVPFEITATNSIFFKVIE